jgi:predicted sulfurtransferase
MREFYMVWTLAFLFAMSAPMGVYAEEEIKTPDQLIKEAKAQIKEISVEEAKKMADNKEKVIFLDVRDKDEYDRGHLPGAIHMSRGALDFHVREIIPDKNAKIVVI